MKRLLIALVLLAGCIHEALPPGRIVSGNVPARLYCVEENADGVCQIFRSDQPTAAQFIVLRDKYGLRSSFKLNPAVEAHDALPPGVELIDHPMSSVLEPEEAEVQQICRDLDDAPKPTIIHCTAGRERTGFIVERCVRGRHKALSPSGDAQCGEWLAYGMRPVLAPGLILAFHRETGVWCR